MTPDPAAISAFLSSVVRTDIHIVALSGDASHGSYHGADVTAATAWALAYNAVGWNVYWTVNTVVPGTHSKPPKSAITSARFVHVDIDPPRGTPLGAWDKAAALQRLVAMNPTAIIDSGGGLQGLWRLAEPAHDLPAVEAVNRGAIAAVDGDPPCWNIDRLLRLPGTVNYPSPSKVASGRTVSLATLVQPDNGSVFDLAGLFAPVVREATPGMGAWTAAPVPEWCGPADDDVLIQRMLSARDSAAVALGGKAAFRDLWTANAAALSAAFPPDGDSAAWNASNADQALFTRLAWWAGRDCERVRRLAMRSGLVRDKWTDRPEYVEGSILRACAGVVGVLQDKPPAPMPPAEPVVRGVARAERPPSGIQNDKNDHALIIEWLWARGWDVRYDMFRDRIMLDDDTVLDDHIERAAWFDVRSCATLKFSKELFGDALRARAYERRFHPVRDYLDAMQPTWDGVTRVDTWLQRYAGVADTAYHRAVGRLFLLAAVRRARNPGVKFDEMLVLLGPQGIEKSSLFEALCPDPSWFTDSIALGMSTKEIMEATQGAWIVEAPELSKLSDTQVEHVKAMLSRRFDKARLAYGRNPVTIGRSSVWGGTSNGLQLRDKTGNRRFWPAMCGTIDLPTVRTSRDQIWAEAAHREAAGESIRLPRELWADAAAEQALYVADDPLERKIASILGNRTGRVQSGVIWDALGLPIDRQRVLSRAYGEAMVSLGWERKKISVHGEKLWFYVKGSDAREIITEMGVVRYADPAVAVVSS